MMTIDALNRGLILPCATALLKMRPYMINSSLAHGLQRLHLESVAFETGDMAALCELFPNVRVASFDCCILSRCSAVPEAVRGWEGLQECLFLGDEEQNFGLGKYSFLIKHCAKKKRKHYAGSDNTPAPELSPDGWVRKN